MAAVVDPAAVEVTPATSKADDIDDDDDDTRPPPRARLAVACMVLMEFIIGVFALAILGSGAFFYHYIDRLMPKLAKSEFGYTQIAIMICAAFALLVSLVGCVGAIKRIKVVIGGFMFFNVFVGLSLLICAIFIYLPTADLSEVGVIARTISNLILVAHGRCCGTNTTDASLCCGGGPLALTANGTALLCQQAADHGRRQLAATTTTTTVSSAYPQLFTCLYPACDPVESRPVGPVGCSFLSHEEVSPQFAEEICPILDLSNATAKCANQRPT